MPAVSRILILGASGGLGRALLRRLSPHHPVTAWTREELDLSRPETISRTLGRHDFDVLLNPAGMTSPDTCEAQPEQARLVNECGPQALAEHCHKHGRRLVHFSTDYVFSGEARAPWTEDAPAEPVNTYGLTKRDGERAVLKASPDALVARVSWLFGPDKPSHPDHVIERALQGDDVTAVADKISVPTSTADVSEWIARLIQNTRARGLLHLCNNGAASWHSWAQHALEIASRLGLPLKTTLVRPIQLAELTQLKAARPRMTVMSNSRLQELLGDEIRDWSAALESYLTAGHRKK